MSKHSILNLAINKARSRSTLQINPNSVYYSDDDENIEGDVSVGAFSYGGQDEQELYEQEYPYIIEEPKNWLAPEDDYMLELTIREYDKDMRHFRLIFILINILGLFLAAIITFICVKWLDGFSLHPDRASTADYNVHLVFTIIGFVMAPAYAMLIFRTFPHAELSRLIFWHIMVLMLMSFLASFGVKIAYDSHHVYGRNHLFSLHSWVGLTISALLMFLIISGTWLYFSEHDLPYMKYLHGNLGIIMFGLSVAASISGILTRSKHTVTNTKVGDPIPRRAIILNTLGLALTIFSVLVRYLLSEMRFRRRPRPGSQEKKLQQGFSSAGASSGGHSKGHRHHAKKQSLSESDFKEHLRTLRQRGSSAQELHKVSFSKPNSGDRKYGSESGILKKSRSKRLSPSSSTAVVVLDDNLFGIPNL